MSKNIGFFDLTSGVSSDMLIASLCHQAVPQDYLVNEIAKLNMNDIQLNFQTKIKNGIAGIHFSITASNKQEHRNLDDILNIINHSDLNSSVKKLASKTFEKLAVCEAQVHNIDLKDIHFHEVGAMDSILDVIIFAICIDYLNLDQIIATPITTGFGTVKAAHGLLPVPAPATAELLKNVPSIQGETQGEMATPTGVALISTVTNKFEMGYPEMCLESVGYGIGSRDYPKNTPLRFIKGKTN